METQVTESPKKKIPVRPLQWLGSPGPFWKAICPFGLSWALAFPCSQSGKTHKVSKMKIEQNTHWQCHTQGWSIHWCALILVWLLPILVRHCSGKCETVSSEGDQSHIAEGNCQHPHLGSAQSWGALHPLGKILGPFIRSGPGKPEVNNVVDVSRTLTLLRAAQVPKAAWQWGFSAEQFIAGGLGWPFLLPWNRYSQRKVRLQKQFSV